VLQTVCRKLQDDSGTGGFLASELPFHGWKSPEIAWGEIWTPQAWWMSCRVSYPLFPSRTQNSVAQRWRSTKEISSCSTILKMVLLKWP
jgi:hypothetical protein